MSVRTASRLVVIFAAGGLATSIYLTIAHYVSPNVLACSASGVVNCEQVTTSSESMILGVPVAVLGGLWFASILLISLPRFWDHPTIYRARIVWSFVGMAFVLWLVYAELVLIGAICLWCTVAHLFALGVFLVVLIEASRAQVADG